MHSSIASFQWLLYIFTVISSLQVSATRFNIPRLSPTRGTILQNPEILSATISEDFQTFYYNQTLDHFNYRPESYSTFQQRYVINFKYWGGSAGVKAGGGLAKIKFALTTAQRNKQKRNRRKRDEGGVAQRNEAHGFDLF